MRGTVTHLYWNCYTCTGLLRTGWTYDTKLSNIFTTHTTDKGPTTKQDLHTPHNHTQTDREIDRFIDRHRERETERERERERER